MRKLLLCLILLAPMAMAQQARLPDFSSVFVNDYADLMSNDAEQELIGHLSNLKTETGVEMSVLTIKTRDTYGLHGSFESFARDTFNKWGIGDASKNNGILLLVVSEDREMRIELGSGYGSGMKQAAEQIIDQTILPHFVDQDFERGILRGSEEIERKIARGDPSGAGGFKSGNIMIAGAAAVFAFIMGSKFLARRRKRQCPACKSDDIYKTQDSAAGHGHSCRNCGHSYVLPFARNNRDDGSSNQGGGFGGGSSSGGGASGRW